MVVNGLPKNSNVFDHGDDQVEAVGLVFGREKVVGEVLVVFRIFKLKKRGRVGGGKILLIFLLLIEIIVVSFLDVFEL